MNIAHSVFHFFKHWLLEIDDHSLHSPYLFNLYSNTIRKIKNIPVDPDIENLRNRYKRDHRVISGKNYGAGSRLNLNKKNRTLNNIVHSGISKPKYSRLLLSLINYFQSENLIELGTSIGLNTLYLSKGMHVKHLATFEGNPDLAGLALTHFKAFSKDGIQLVAGDIGYTLPEYLEKADPVDFAFLDAHHTAEATLRYLAMLMPRLTERSVIVIDDIYWSAGMTQAWKRITEDHHEYLYLDLLKMGVMIRDKNAPQGYYVLSY